MRPVFKIADTSNVELTPISPEKQALLDKIKANKDDQQSLYDVGFIKKKSPVKPIKRKSLKRVVIGDAIAYEKWTPMIEEWCNKHNHKIELMDDVDRVDIRSSKEDEDWRIVIMGVYGGEFDVTIFYDSTVEAWNQKRVNIQYIRQESVIEALDVCITIRNKFKET